MTNISDSHQFFLPCRVRFFSCHIFSQFTVTLSKSNGRIYTDDAGIPEIHLFLLFFAIYEGAGNPVFAFFPVVCKPTFQDIKIVRQDMARIAVPSTDGENPAFFSMFNIIRQFLFGKMVETLIFPFGQIFFHQFPVLCRYPHGVTGTGFEIINFPKNPFRCVFREKRGASWCFSLIANDEFPVLNENRHPAQDIIEHMRLLQDRWFRCIEFDGFCRQFGPFCRKSGDFIIQHLFQPGNARCHLIKFFTHLFLLLYNISFCS